jgi:hypothetical protein
VAMNDWFIWLFLSWWMEDTENKELREENRRLREELAGMEAEDDYDPGDEDQDENYDDFDDYGIYDYPEDN